MSLTARINRLRDKLLPRAGPPERVCVITDLDGRRWRASPRKRIDVRPRRKVPPMTREERLALRALRRDPLAHFQLLSAPDAPILRAAYIDQLPGAAPRLLPWKTIVAFARRFQLPKVSVADAELPAVTVSLKVDPAEASSGVPLSVAVPL